MKEGIETIAKAMRELTKKAAKEYRSLVEEIINSKSNNQNHIQNVLDGMLDFCFDDKMLLLYKKLCRYYYDINPAATADYVMRYKEMWDSE